MNFKHELIISMVQEYINHGIELTPGLLEGFAFRDRMLVDNVEFLSPEHMQAHAQFVEAFPGVLEEMADIETSFVLG